MHYTLLRSESILAQPLFPLFDKENVQVPFAIVALLDHVRQKKLPPELKCRQVCVSAKLDMERGWEYELCFPPEATVTAKFV